MNGRHFTSVPLFGLLVLVFGGCVSASSVVSPEVADDIPDGADVIQIESNESPDELYRSIYQALAADGFEIAESNEGMGTLSTSYRDIGQSTTLKVVVDVRDRTDGATGVLRGQWGVTGDFATSLSAGVGAAVSQEGSTARWGEMGRSSVAFGYLAELVNQELNGRITYD